VVKTETYIPLRYRKFHSPVIFRQGYFPLRYSPVDNTYVMPYAIAEHLANWFRLRKKNITAEDLINGVYRVYVVYRDDDKTILTVTDRYGNSQGLIMLPNKVFEYYSQKRLFIP